MRFFTDILSNERSSDPYAVIRIGSQEYTTKTVQRQINPTFNVTCDIPGNGYFYFKILEVNESFCIGKF